MTIRQVLLLIVIAGLFGLAMAGCLIRCTDVYVPDHVGVTISLVAPEQPANVEGELVFSFTMPDRTLTTRCAGLGTACTLDGDHTTTEKPIFFDTSTTGWRISIEGAPKTVAVHATIAGRVALAGAVTPTYSTTMPNGQGCGETKSAEVSFVLDPN